MEEEMNYFIENISWTLVYKPKRKKKINCRWAYIVKFENESHIRYKANVVAKAYNKVGIYKQGQIVNSK